jgi:hypothetical protein
MWLYLVLLVALASPWAIEALTAHGDRVLGVQMLDQVCSIVHPVRNKMSRCAVQPLAGLVADVPGVDASAVPANAQGEMVAIAGCTTMRWSITVD